MLLPGVLLACIPVSPYPADPIPSASPTGYGTSAAAWSPGTIEQRTDRGHDYNRELAVLAGNNGFDHTLSKVRYMAGYGAEYQHESTSFSLALLLATERLKVIAVVHPAAAHA